ncbi:MAG TPA: AraC family transcriptional regulator [Planctomycetota bacterium]|nr:AraC family transcriptional regulator [Planctomycetota bacterium]
MRSASTMTTMAIDRDPHRVGVARVIGEMRARIDGTFPIAEMARIAGLSPCQFGRVFARLTGVTPHRFLSALRLQAAKRLLLTSDRQVTEISLDVGRDSLGTFISSFTRYVGLSPSRFRARSRRRAPMPPPASRPVPAPGAGRIAGSIDAGGRVGHVLVAAFAEPIPQGRPHACAMVATPGGFTLAPVPAGRSHLFAVLLPDAGDDDALAGALVGSAASRLEAGAEQRVDLRLRPIEVFDPPLVYAFALLMPATPSHAAAAAGEAFAAARGR